MIGVLLALSVLLVIATALARANEVFLLSARHGHTLLVRGGLSLTLRHELSAVLGAERAHRVTVRGVRTGGSTVLIVSGAAPHLAQRLRNAFAAHGGSRAPLLQPPPGKRNLGQRLGIVWLAWWLS